MLKLLLKKQLVDINRTFFQDRKTGKMRSKAASIAWIVGYAMLMIFVLGGMFIAVALKVCGPLVSAGMTWLYFTVFSLIAVAMGVFGSVFNTYAGLYQAKDNDLLLSMPIPVRYILVSRLLGVYLMGLMFSAIIIIPAVIAYFVTVPFSFKALIGSLALIAVISVIVMMLSCLLGWVIAKISAKVKNKSFVTVVSSLLFLGIYYFAYFKANELLQSLVENAATVGAEIKTAAYPLYMIGKVGEGDPVSVIVTVAVSAALLALTYFVLSKTFLKMATGSSSIAKKAYVEKAMKRKSVRSALYGREMSRLLASPTYMLNCALGTLLIIAAAVAVLIKGSDLITALNANIPELTGFVAPISCALLCFLSAMNDLTAPSVSLEGKSLWLAQSLPVDPWAVLRAKLELHISLTAVPTLLCGVCLCTVFRLSVVSSVLVLFVAVAYIVFYAALGLVINLKMPNLNWTSEVVAVKQSIGILIALLSGWFYVLALGAAFFALRNTLSSDVLMLILGAVTSLAAFGLIRYIKTAGAKIFAAL